jgi:putative spermidine/putrescine transport system permease protein
MSGKTDRQLTGAPAPWRWSAQIGANLVIAFLVLPILAVIPTSFNASSFISLPPAAWSTRWYSAFFADPEWRSALWVSIQVAVMATAVALAVGLPAALGLQRTGPMMRPVLSGLFLAPMIVPVIVTAVAIYRTALDVGLSGTRIGMALSHAALALPFVVINIGVSLRGVDRRWQQAAAGLGASAWTVFRTITLPNIMPGVVGGAVFAFISSFDEVVVAVFMAGYGAKTLPVKIWEAIRIEFTPVTAVAATFMIVLAALLFVLARAIDARRQRALGSKAAAENAATEDKTAHQGVPA